MDTTYDLIIIGAGPAGLSASIYASRFGIKHLILAKEKGGTIVWASEIENYPGIDSVSGVVLAQQFLEHAQKLGAKIENQEVMKIIRQGNVFHVVTTNNSLYQAKSLIIATGTKRRELGVPGEKEFLGKGVSYCCTCDAAFFKGKTAAVVGGANAACSGAIHLSKFADKVYLIYRQSKLKAEEAWLKDVLSLKNVQIIYETTVTEIKGKLSVEKIVLDKPFEGSNELAVSGVFVEVGGVPLSEIAKDLGIEIDEAGYVITDKNMVTKVAGIFCAGDLNSFWRDLKQIITANAQGAIAAFGVYKYLKGR